MPRAILECKFGLTCYCRSWLVHPSGTNSTLYETSRIRSDVYTMVDCSLLQRRMVRRIQKGTSSDQDLLFSFFFSHINASFSVDIAAVLTYDFQKVSSIDYDFTKYSKWEALVLVLYCTTTDKCKYPTY